MRYRDELASAINLPVLASIECERCRSVKDWKHLLESYQPSPVDLWNFRRLIHRLIAGDGEELVQINLLSFASDTPALAVSVEFARCAAELGIETQLVPENIHRWRRSGRLALFLVRGFADGPYGLEGENRDEDFRPSDWHWW